MWDDGKFVIEGAVERQQQQQLHPHPQSLENCHVSNNHNQQIHANRNFTNNYYDSTGMDVSFWNKNNKDK